MAVRILHLADIHLGAVQKFLPAEKQEIRTEEIYKSFADLINSILEKHPQPDAILISGDLFDSPLPETSLLTKVENLFKNIANANIPVILIPGNHDNIITPNSVYRKVNFPGVFPLLMPTIKEPLELNLQGELFHFYGMAYSFLSRLPFDEFRPINPDAHNIALIHGSLTGHAGWQIHSQDVPLNKSNLFKTGFDYIALGHYHDFQHYMGNGTHIVYPGSLEPLNWTEEASRKVVFIEFGDNGLTIKTENFGFQRKFYMTIKLDASQFSFKSSKDIADYVISNYGNENYLLRIILAGPIEFVIDTRKIEAICQSRFFYVRVEDHTTINTPENMERYQQEDTIRGLVVRKLLHRIKKTENEEENANSREALKILMSYFSMNKDGE